jgi:hypothetical protein
LGSGTLSSQLSNVELALTIRLKHYSASLNLIACCISYAIHIKNVPLFWECLARAEIVLRNTGLQDKPPNFILGASRRLEDGNVFTRLGVIDT